MYKLQKRKKNNVLRRKARIRSVVFGTAERPRLHVFKSNRGLFVQLIDDAADKTVASVSIKEIAAADNKTTAAQKAGTLIAEKAKQKNIKSAVFDRGGNKYHGRIKALAEAARTAGLQI